MKLTQTTLVAVAAFTGLLAGCSTTPAKSCKGNACKMSSSDKSNCGSKSNCNSKSTCRAKGNCGAKKSQ